LKTLQKLPKNVRDLGKFIVAKGFKKLPKVQKIAQSGHTACYYKISQGLRPIVVITCSNVFSPNSLLPLFPQKSKTKDGEVECLKWSEQLVEKMSVFVTSAA